MVSTRSKTGATPARSPLKTISKKRHAKHPASPRRSAPVAFPDVSLNNDSGIVVSTHSLLSDAAPGLILFTYPRANTGGCTTQAKGLSALREPALAAGYSIVGCSYDSVKTQASWKVKSSISLMLLSDTPSSGLLRKLSVHKAPRGVKRSVFVITRKGDALDIVLAKRAVAPKECITLIEQYIKDNPLKPPSAKTDPDHVMTDDKPQPQQSAPASAPAAPQVTDVAGKADEPEDKQPPEQPKHADQQLQATETANHANADQAAPKESVAAAPAAEQSNHMPADASKSQPEETANKTTVAEAATQSTTGDKPADKPAEPNLSSKEQKDSTDAKPEGKAEEKESAASTEKPVVMDTEKPKEESKA